MANAYISYLRWSFQHFLVQVHHKMREWSILITNFAVFRYYLKQRKMDQLKSRQHATHGVSGK
jgi:hypothetical protein